MPMYLKIGDKTLSLTTLPKNDQHGFEWSHIYKEMVMGHSSTRIEITEGLGYASGCVLWLKVYVAEWQTPEVLNDEHPTSLRIIWPWPTGISWTPSVTWTGNTAFQISQRHLPLISLFHFFLYTQTGKLTNFLKNIWKNKNTPKTTSTSKYESWRQKCFTSCVYYGLCGCSWVNVLRNKFWAVAYSLRNAWSTWVIWQLVDRQTDRQTVKGSWESTPERIPHFQIPPRGSCFSKKKRAGKGQTHHQGLHMTPDFILPTSPFSLTWHTRKLSLGERTNLRLRSLRIAITAMVTSNRFQVDIGVQWGFGAILNKERKNDFSLRVQWPKLFHMKGS